MATSGPRVFDGKGWVSVKEEPSEGGRPIPPVADGDGSIFVSIVSYRDGERCGETLRSLFENSAQPDKIVVGLFEQNSPEDKFCIEQYCSYFGAKTVKRQTIRKDVVKVVAEPKGIESCPHHDQIRLVAYHHIQAKGPTYARSMIRKVLGNEEYCMQVDAHTEFTKQWDKVAVSEWKQARNEFGILSTVPAPKAEKDNYTDGASKFTEVPRQCSLRFQSNGIPDYASPADGNVADLDKPLLGHGWSAAFSFAKCHLEESAPYDTFSLYAMPVEQFSRFARFWTRGYDVYTPTRNIVFHDYNEQANGHGANEWFKRQRDRFRLAAIVRAKTLLELPIPGGETDVNAQANLGIYGLGKRRTLDQLSVFCGIDLKETKGNMGQDACSGHQWVPYDESISPTDNLYTNPSNLDPQPEYPHRTNMVYYQQVAQYALPQQVQAEVSTSGAVERQLPQEIDRFDSSGTSPSTAVFFVLWFFGLLAWYMVFMPNSVTTRKERSSTLPKKSTHQYKDV